MTVDFSKAYPALTQLLLRQRKQESAAHAYAFIGRRGIGKASLAEGFANALVELEPRGSGASHYFTIDLARDWMSNLHPDIVFLRPEDGAAHIGIDAARSFQHTMHEKPFIGSRRVGVIVHAEMLTHEAMASILKLLEEPPGKAVLILLGESESAFPKTILSRCQVLRMPRLADDTLAEILQITTENEEDRLTLELAHGRLRLGAAFVMSSELREQHSLYMQETIAILEQRTASREMRSRMQDAEAVRQQLDILEILLSDLLTGHLFGASAIRSTALRTVFISLSRRLSLRRMGILARFIRHARKLLAANVSPQGVYEQLLVTL
ncbi:MAG: hypothetical protein WCV86_03380 [Patescibacteria group bacterium]